MPRRSKGERVAESSLRLGEERAHHVFIAHAHEENETNQFNALKKRLSSSLKGGGTYE